MSQLLEHDQPIKITPLLEKIDIRLPHQILSMIFILSKFHLSLHTGENVSPHQSPPGDISLHLDLDTSKTKHLRSIPSTSSVNRPQLGIVFLSLHST